MAKPDLTPIKFTKADWDRLAGIDGLTPEQLAAARAWGTPKLKALLAAREDDDERA